MLYNLKQTLLAALGAVAACFLFASCGEDVQLALGVTPTTVNIPAKGGSATVAFSAPGDWEATSNAEWLTLSPSKGTAGDMTMTITAAANKETAPRTTTVKVSIPETGLSESVVVSQEAGEPDPVLEVSPDKGTVPATGGSLQISITANNAWTVTCSETWVSIAPASGKDNATVTLLAAANTQTKARTATILVASGSLSKAVTLTQEAAVPDPVLEVSPLQASFKAEGGNIQITVTANNAWTATCSDSWISLSAASGTANATVVLTAAKNTVTRDRAATVTVSSGNLSKTITVTQEAAIPDPVLEVTPDKGSFTAEGGNIQFNITANNPWTATCSESWIQLAPASGSSSGTITVVASANTVTQARTATVLITSSNLSKAITLTQEPKPADPVLEVTPTTLTAPAEGGTFQVAISANYAWTATTTESWVSFSPASGEGNAFLTVTIAENTVTQQRATALVISSGNLAKTVMIMQDAAVPPPMLEVSPEDVSISSEGGVIQLTVTANNPWFAVADEQWISVTPETGNGNGVILLSVAKNPDPEDRTAHVQVTSGELSFSVSILQEAAPRQEGPGIGGGIGDWEDGDDGEFKRN